MSGPFKMKGFPAHAGVSPMKKAPGIFDSKGNRISTGKASELEAKGELVTYTEGDAIKKAHKEADKETTTKGKSKWLKEASEQSKTMSERMTDPTPSHLGGTKGEHYTLRHRTDARLQKYAEEGTYTKKHKEEESGQGVFGSKSLSRKSYGSGNFPTEGQIRKTKRDVDYDKKK
tara:strand:+ start:155 stop:676 length:522 start_codon:yes stop_codon:yes gene_type:complete